MNCLQRQFSDFQFCITRLKAVTISKCRISELVIRTSSHIFGPIYIKNCRPEYSFGTDLVSDCDTCLKSYWIKSLNGQTSNLNHQLLIFVGPSDKLKQPYFSISLHKKMTVTKQCVSVPCEDVLCLVFCYETCRLGGNSWIVHLKMHAQYFFNKLIKGVILANPCMFLLDFLLSPFIWVHI